MLGAAGTSVAGGCTRQRGGLARDSDELAVLNGERFRPRVPTFRHILLGARAPGRLCNDEATRTLNVTETRQIMGLPHTPLQCRFRHAPGGTIRPVSARGVERRFIGRIACQRNMVFPCTLRAWCHRARGPRHRDTVPPVRRSTYPPPPPFLRFFCVLCMCAVRLAPRACVLVIWPFPSHFFTRNMDMCYTLLAHLFCLLCASLCVLRLLQLLRPHLRKYWSENTMERWLQL